MPQRFAIFACLFLGSAMAEDSVEIHLSKNAFTRTEEISGTIRFAKPLTGAGKVVLRWTDCFGRTVFEREEPAEAGQKELPFELPAAPALGLGNTLTAELHAGPSVSSATAGFIATPDYEPWDDYQIMMYYSYKPEFQDRLRELGINSGMNQGRSRLLDASNEKTKIWWGYGYRYYAEQIMPDIYANYHRSQPDNKPKEWLLMQAKELYKKDKTKKDAFFRSPCFSDPAVRQKIEETMAKAVAINHKLAPVFYSLADEAGVANLPSAWDFCFDPRSLADMREWLKIQYKTLDALNAEWETSFKTWDEVTPLSTDEMMKKGGDNLSPWADHRTYMEKAFADAVKWGADATWKADPNAYVGLVGCQMPSAFGGYDYWRLSQVMNAIEPYNIGNNREIWRSFRPDAPAVTTSFGNADQEVWRLWYQLLHGDRGIIIYDEKNLYLDDKGNPTDVGQKAAVSYRELTGGICKLLSNCKEVNDPIAIHYSQASIHAHWMLETRPDGESWIERGSATERKKSEFLRLRESFTKLIEDQQLQYTFVSYAQLERGDLEKNPPKLLFLPQSIAMSAAECAAVRKYVEDGGTLVADSRCALMDEHCKRLEKGRLDDLFGITRKDQEWKPGEKGVTNPVHVQTFGSGGPPFLGHLDLSPVERGLKIDAPNALAHYKDKNDVPAVIWRHAAGHGHTFYLNLDLTDYHRWRLKPGEDKSARRLISELIRYAGIRQSVSVSKPDGEYLPGVEVHTFTNGDEKIVAIQRNPQLRINELGPPESNDYKSNEAFQKDEQVNIDFGAEYEVYDTRLGSRYDRLKALSVQLKAYEPLIFTLLPRPPGELTIQAKALVKRGEAIALSTTFDVPADVCAFHLEIFGPNGKAIPCYTRNLKAPKGSCSATIYLALSDPAGTYTISIHDVATGTSAHKTVEAE